jgi:hypothetical protein
MGSLRILCGDDLMNACLGETFFIITEYNVDLSLTEGFRCSVDFPESGRGHWSRCGNTR